MRKIIIAIVIIILFLSLVSITSSRHSEEFIDQVADMICNDCQSKDIYLSKPITVYPNDGSSSYDIYNITWPYDKSIVKFIINVYSNTNFSYIQGTCDNKITFTSGPDIIDGCGLLRCGNYKLNINGDNYYWNGEMIDFLKKEEMHNIASGNNNTQIIAKGDSNALVAGNNNIANTGENCTITKQDLSFSFTKGFAWGAVLTFLLETAIILYQRWQKKKKESGS